MVQIVFFAISAPFPVNISVVRGLLFAPILSMIIQSLS